MRCVLRKSGTRTDARVGAVISLVGPVAPIDKARKVHKRKEVVVAALALAIAITVVAVVVVVAVSYPRASTPIAEEES